MDQDVQLPRSEPPRGMYPSRLDDKGRIKLPSVFQQFVAGLPEKRLFVTSLDRHIARIYPMDIWRQVEKFFETYRENPRVAEDVAFVANELGAEVEMDTQGRITFPSELRTGLGLENQTLRLYAYKGRIEVLSEKIFEERKRSSIETGPSGVKILEGAGMP